MDADRGRDDFGVRTRRRRRTHRQNRGWSRAALGDNGDGMERPEPQLSLQCLSFRPHRGLDGVFRDARSGQLADRRAVPRHSPPDRLFTHVCRRTLFVGCRLRRRHRARHSVLRRALDSLPNTQLNGGGGGIRTHEGFRPAGFQDRSHQPLDHPSQANSVAPIVPLSCHRARWIERSVARCREPRLLSAPSNIGGLWPWRCVAVLFRGTPTLSIFFPNNTAT